jgi:N-acetylneuraminic acid mutarotase
MEEYNPSANTWLSKTAGLVSSSYHSEFVINDKIYIAGGVLVGYAATNLVSEYTPATDTWAVKAVVPISRWGSCSASIN